MLNKSAAGLPAGAPKKLGSTGKINLRQYSMFIALVGIGLIFQILTEGIFLSPRNLSNLFMQQSFIAILAIGQLLVIIAGYIDISVGSLVGFLGGIAAILQVRGNWGTWPAILVTVVLGFVIGIWQGYWVAYQDIPAMLVTLAGMLIFRGALIAMTGGQTVAPLHDDFNAIGSGYLPQLFIKGEDIAFNDFSCIIAVLSIIAYNIIAVRKRNSKKRYGLQVPSAGRAALQQVIVSILLALVFAIMIFYQGIPYSILLVFVLIVVFSFLTDNTVFGQQVYALGGNREAARLSGVNIKKRILSVFALMGLLSAFAGIVFTGRLNSATASAGDSFEMDAIASCYIGGASAVGGEGTVLGAIIGALVMGSLNNGMSLMNIDVAYQKILKGLILLLAVWFDIASRRKKN